MTLDILADARPMPRNQSPSPYDKIDRKFKRLMLVAYWSAIAIAWLAAVTAIYLVANHEMRVDHTAPRCVIDPDSHLWRGPPL